MINNMNSIQFNNNNKCSNDNILAYKNNNKSINRNPTNNHNVFYNYRKSFSLSKSYYQIINNNIIKDSNILINNLNDNKKNFIYNSPNINKYYRSSKRISYNIDT